MGKEGISLYGWSIFIIILAVLVFCFFYRKRQQQEEKRLHQEEKQLIFESIHHLMKQCWEQYIALCALKYFCNLSRKIICDEGILYYYQRLCSLLSCSWNEEQLASRINGIVANGLHNVMLSHLKQGDEGFMLPSETPDLLLEKDTYFFRIGIDTGNLAIDLLIENKLKNELARISKEKKQIEEGSNGLFYQKLLLELIPIVTSFCGNEKLEDMHPAEVIRESKKFKEAIEEALHKYQVSCIPYAEATQEQQHDWFIHTLSENVGEMPAIVRISDGAVYYKGVFH